MKINSITLNNWYTVVLLVLMGALLSFKSSAQLQAYKKGLASFEKGYYNTALNFLKKVEEIDESQKLKLNYTIAEAYRLSNRWIESIPFYEKAIEKGSNDKEVIFHLAYAYKASAQYDKALEYYKKYGQSGHDNKVYNEWANREINTLQIVDVLKLNDVKYDFRNLKEVNTEGAEFSPLVYNGKLIYSASRKDKVYSNGLPFLGIYAVDISEDLGTIGEEKRFSAAIFDDERNEGTPTFSPDGRTVIFARSNSGKRKDLSPDVDLYISRLVPSSGWTDPQLVSASDSASWDGCPSFSGDGKTIYFASNRAGGNGGMDLYRVNMDASGRFGNPKNMGKSLNTPGNEMFPYVSPEGKLYFASDGHPGLGKLDLFVAVRKKGKISVENMGLPFNSSLDDFAFSEDPAGNKFFSSNRLGGVGDDDIYFYQAPKEPELAEVLPVKPKEPEEKETELKIVNYFLSGLVKDKQTSEVIPNVQLEVYEVSDTDEEEVNLLTTTTPESGTFGPVKLDEDTEYLIIASKEEYLLAKENFSMYGRTIPQLLLKEKVTDTTFTTTLYLDKVFVGKTFVLENIYYDLDKFEIRADAAEELNKLVEILYDNPGIRIELGSHTDARGTAVYNQRLSQKRAESAVNYIVSQGIDRGRIEAQGYGEEELLIEVARTEEEHQQNRRTEFKIISLAEKEESR